MQQWPGTVPITHDPNGPLSSLQENATCLDRAALPVKVVETAGDGLAIKCHPTLLFGTAGSAKLAHGPNRSKRSGGKDVRRERDQKSMIFSTEEDPLKRVGTEGAGGLIQRGDVIVKAVTRQVNGYLRGFRQATRIADQPVRDIHHRRCAALRRQGAGLQRRARTAEEGDCFLKWCGHRGAVQTG